MSDEVINICFHGVGTPGREMEPGEDKYWVSVDAFHAILDEVKTWPSVRISFDDGNTSDLVYGLPALLERQLTADFFVLSARLDQPGSLDEDDVRELHRYGMTIGSHGMWHRPWRGMDGPTRDDELVAARKTLAAVIGADVDTAACPLGRYDRALLGHLRRLGYTRVFTSDRRRADADSWLQPRFSVTCDDTPESLRAEALDGPGMLNRLVLETKGVIKRLR